jgi:hypothetical protein
MADVSVDTAVELSLVHTSCQGCGWARQEGNTQVECELGHLEGWRQEGGRVVEAYCGEDNFYILDGCACPDKRLADWFRGLSLEEARDKLEKEHRVRLKIFVQTSPVTELHELTATLGSIGRQTRPVQEVVILDGKRTAARYSGADLLDYLQEQTYPWRIHRPLGEPYPGRDIDDCVKGDRSLFYAVVRAGFRLPETLVEELDEAIWARRLKFLHLLPRSDGNGEIIHTYAHNLLGGNRPAQSTPDYGEVRLANSIGEKIRVIAEDQNKLTLIREVGDVLPSMHESCEAPRDKLKGVA